MNKRASLLIVSLWILAILVIFAVGLGYRVWVALQSARFQVDSLKAMLYCKEAVIQAIQISVDDIRAESATKEHDTIAHCGINPAGKNMKEVFYRQLANAAEGFSVGFMDVSGELTFGVRDEERKININGVSGAGKNSLIQALLSVAGVEDAADSQLAATLAGWTDEASKIDSAKKAPFSAPEEMLGPLEYYYKNIRGLGDSEAKKKVSTAYSALKDLITVYPQKVNLNTASRSALQILMQAVLGSSSADLLDKIEQFRQAGGVFLDPADIVTQMSGLTPEEQTALTSLANYLCTASDYLQIEARGFSGSLTRYVSVVYDRKNNSLVSWRQN
jgi:type II secretory pathway component PulK